MTTRTGRYKGTRPGITMLELIVVVAIMGIMAGIVGLAVLQSPVPSQTASLASAHAVIADARRDAIQRGVPLSISVSVGAQPPEHGIFAASARAPERTGSAVPILLRVTAFPDGSVVADPELGIDRLTGRPRRAPQSGEYE